MSSSQTVTTCLPVMDDRSGFFCIRGTDLERLTKDDLEAIADWLRGAASLRNAKNPFPISQKRSKPFSPVLNEHDRVTAVMACATGKTLVALWLAERMKAKRILVLVPSLALIRQTLHEWLKETSLGAAPIYRRMLRSDGRAREWTTRSSFIREIWTSL